MYEAVAEYVFREGGNGAKLLIEGWGPLEPGHVWSVALRTRLRIPLPPGEGEPVLLLTITGFTWHPFFRQQRLEISINGVALPPEHIEGESALGYRLPEAVFGRPDVLDIELRHPEALCPKEAGLSTDERRLGIALHEVLLLRGPPEPLHRRRTLPPLPITRFDFSAEAQEIVRGVSSLYAGDLVLQFESLGQNCEFGLVQRKLGAEPLGLLRFAGISPHRLLRGLDLGFPGVEDIERLRVWHDEQFGNEFMVHHDVWGLEAHTARYLGQTDPDDLRRDQARNFQFCRRKLFETLESGERICVHQQMAVLSEAQMLPLLVTLRSFGPNALLFVRRDASRPAGTVEQLAPDLYMGSIDKLAPVWDVDRTNLTAWLSLCANAYRLWREAGGGAP